MEFSNTTLTVWILFQPNFGKRSPVTVLTKVTYYHFKILKFKLKKRLKFNMLAHAKIISCIYL